MLFRGLFFVGTHLLTVDTPFGRRMRPHIRHGGAPLLRFRRADLCAAGVERVLARTVGVQDGLPKLDDGRILDVRNIVWCTGFKRDYSWIDFPVAGADGYPRHQGGVADGEPGLYFVGLPFQTRLASALIGGVGEDARFIADAIANRLGAEHELHSVGAEAELAVR